MVHDRSALLIFVGSLGARVKPLPAMPVPMMPVACHVQVNQLFLEQTRKAVADKDAQIVVYCQAGKRGALATKALQDAGGYSCVLNLAGGLTAWTDAGLPTMQ